jgi:hypothetical protein
MDTNILADVVWPALYLHDRLYSWWGVGLGIVIEFFFIRWLTGLPAWPALRVTLVVNAISSVIGYFAYIWLDLVREFALTYLVFQPFDLGTFSWIGWGSACVYAALINAAIECAAMRIIFRIRITRWFFFWDTVANFLSVAVAFASLFVSPVNLR